MVFRVMVAVLNRPLGIDWSDPSIDDKVGRRVLRRDKKAEEKRVMGGETKGSKGAF